MPNKTTERILGIDPGFARTGYGIVERTGSSMRAIAYGCITTASTMRYTDRLLYLEHEITSVIRRYQPARAAVEQLFFCKNVKTALAVGQARGVVLLTLGRHKLPCTEITPQQVKNFVSGYGKAGKSQVQRMVQLLLKLKEVPTPDDTADALAVAMTASGIRLLHPIV